MIKYIVVLTIAVVAIVTNFSSKKLALMMFKKEDNITQNKIKMFSFFLGIIAFILALLLIK